MARKKANVKRTTRRQPSTQSQPSTSSGSSRSRQKYSTSSQSGASESGSDYEPPTSSTSRNQTRTEQSHEEVTAADNLRLVTDCVFYLLIADQRNYAIKKPEILKHVFKEHKKQYKTIIKEVELYLKKVLGLKLVELESHKGHYILINEMKGANELAKVSKDEKMKLGFTMAVLSIIFMSGNFVTECDMWKTLQKIGFDPDKKHPVLGDVKKLLTQDLARQMYVEYKRENSDPPIFAFSSGPRAKIEVSKLEILQFVCDIFGDNMAPKDWPNQYRDATATEVPVETQS